MRFHQDVQQEPQQGLVQDVAAENMPQLVSDSAEQLLIGEVQNRIALYDDERFVCFQGGRVHEIAQIVSGRRFVPFAAKAGT